MKMLGVMETWQMEFVQPRIPSFFALLSGEESQIRIHVVL
jgi:hypothetical protein